MSSVLGSMSSVPGTPAPHAKTPGGESQVGLFRRRQRPVNGELAAQHEEADERLRGAIELRETEERKLREERRTLVMPLRRVRESNHFADMASQALRRT